jgi:plasmid maintenance system antidote protein VapI
MLYGGFRMTEKRFKKDRGTFWDKDKRLNMDETVDLLNALHEENTRLKEYEKYVGDVKREELDRVFKMSIYEIAEAFQYYEGRIKELEDLE